MMISRRGLFFGAAALAVLPAVPALANPILSGSMQERRLILSVQSNVETLCEELVVGYPNDEKTRAVMAEALEKMLEGYRENRAIQAYSVDCHSRNLPSVIAENRFVGEIVFETRTNPVKIISIPFEVNQGSHDLFRI